ncbi:SGNH/GDSL hydrolase family protein [Actinoplanes sp. NPDC051343]|uniref:SGNH/GDSL hydrolase family protein n=1 Tax=Actinoplanes sp. NPDC051343 TaxID=3363906 RepID=UPI003796F7B7
MKRWHVGVLAALAALALGCEGAATGSQGSGHGSPEPKPGLPASMAALGDSITVGFASCGTVLACGRNSWATGTSADVDSHYLRIKSDNDRIAGHEHNYAVPGARADDLARQAKLAVKAKVDYVTVLIGANDACAGTVDRMTSAATFRSEIDAGLKTLKKGLPKAHVLVVSLPDLYRLWELGHDDAHARRAWKLGICPSLLADPASTDQADQDRRDKVRQRIDDYDDELHDACKAYGDRCRWDHGAVHGVRFSLSLINHLDYFHPDADGQKRLAEVTYPGW